MQLTRLFEPLTVNGMTLKNRVIMPGFHLTYTPGGYANDRYREFYYKRAAGGVGLLILGGFTVEDYCGEKDMCSLKSDDFLPGYQEMVEGIHQRGAKVAAQLFHAGRYAHDVPAGKQALAPSAVMNRITGLTPKAMTKEDIDTCLQNFVLAACRAKKIGFDAVEVSASSGYLLSQFLSPFTNLREDEYGGSWENRVRFPLEVITAVRKAIGPDFPLLVRIAGNDFVAGSNTNEDAVELAKLIEQAGADLINVTGGWHESKVPQITGELPRAGYAYLAQAVKEAVNVPVMVSNRLNDPLAAEEVLALGQGDFVGLARPLLADPEWVNKAQEGRLQEIRRCVSCNQGCLAKTFFGNPVECLVNSLVGREYQVSITAAEIAKRILVIGAGPAGLELAITAAQRGHKVTVWEKDEKTGGQLHLVYVPPGKAEFQTFVAYQLAMVKKLGIELKYNMEAREENILAVAADYDEIILATGAEAKRITLLNDQGKIPQVTASQVLAQEYIPGKDVVIVGGGSVGCETAQYLAQRGAIDAEKLMFLTVHEAEEPAKIKELLNRSVRNVTIVEMTDKIGSNFEPGTGWPVFMDLKRLHVTQHVGATISAVHSDKVIVEKHKGNEKVLIEIPCDTIVLAVGSQSNNSLYESLKDKIPHLKQIGDAKSVGLVSDATREATDLAISL